MKYLFPDSRKLGAVKSIVPVIGVGIAALATSPAAGAASGGPQASQANNLVTPKACTSDWLQEESAPLLSQGIAGTGPKNQNWGEVYLYYRCSDRTTKAISVATIPSQYSAIVSGNLTLTATTESASDIQNGTGAIGASGFTTSPPYTSTATSSPPHNDAGFCDYAAGTIQDSLGETAFAYGKTAQCY